MQVQVFIMMYLVHHNNIVQHASSLCKVRCTHYMEFGCIVSRLRFSVRLCIHTEVNSNTRIYFYRQTSLSCAVPGAP